MKTLSFIIIFFIFYFIFFYDKEKSKEIKKIDSNKIETFSFEVKKNENIKTKDNISEQKQIKNQNIDFDQKLEQIQGYNNLIKNSENEKKENSIYKSDFENFHENEIEDFLKENEIQNIKNKFKKLEKASIKHLKVNKFKGQFEGEVHNFLDHGLFDKNEKIQIIFYLNGELIDKMYSGKYEIKMFRDDTNISTLSGEGNISNLRVGDNIPSLIVSDYQEEPSFFQFFISESGDFLIGNYYESNHKNSKKTATFKLIRNEMVGGSL